jgi:hypothetical protein
MTKAKTRSFNRVREERELADEIWGLAGADAYRRNISHILVGLSRAQIIDWYYSEYPEKQRYAERHIAAGTCADAVTELRSEVAKMPKPPRAPEQPRNPDFDIWAAEFCMEPIAIPSRPKVAAIEWSAKKRPRGIEPVVSNRVEREMRTCDPAELGDMKQATMETKFNASRSTCQKARIKVLSEK